MSLFGTYYRQNAMHVDGLIAYGSTAYDSLRRLGDEAQGVGPGIARSSAAGKQLSGALTSALDLQQGAWRFGPKLGAYYLDVDVGRLNEFGAGDQDLWMGNQTRAVDASHGRRISLGRIAGSIRRADAELQRRLRARQRARGSGRTGSFVPIRRRASF